MKRSMKIFVAALAALVIGEGVFSIRLWRAAHSAPAMANLPASHPEFKLTRPQPDFVVSSFHAGLLRRVR